MLGAIGPFVVPSLAMHIATTPKGFCGLAPWTNHVVQGATFEAVYWELLRLRALPSRHG